MLRFLAVQNLAVIERLELEFGPGLTVLTGETGAGKSILVEAINLLVGGRASPDLVRTGSDSATIQALFDTPDGREVIARREITSQGRSRAFLDGALTTASGLREQVLPLIDLHGQHEHQALLDPETHLDVLDNYADLRARRQAVAEAFTAWRKCREELEQARRDERERDARMDLLTFQTQEIDRVAPHPGEDEQLAATRKLLASAEKVQRLCAEGYAALYESDDAVLPTLGGVWKRVGELATVDPAFGSYLDARDAIKSQLEDLAAVFRDYAANLDASPARLQEVEDRLALIERLKRKHGPTLADVIDRQAAMKRELDLLGRAGERATELEGVVQCARQAYLSLAEALSADRRRAAEHLARELEREVASLAMEHTRFEVRFEAQVPEARWSERGVDAAEFYVSPNPGEELRALARIASGGELSRVMLGLKTIATTDVPGKTLIFDEVDAGIGGRVADAVGSRLQALADGFQVLCITHLPQIAAHAHSHFRVAKAVQANRTTTNVERLRETIDRVGELARMIAGSAVSSTTLVTAEDMLARRAPERAEASEHRASPKSPSVADRGAPSRDLFPGASDAGKQAKGHAATPGESEGQAKAKVVPGRKAKAKGEG